MCFLKAHAFPQGTPSGALTHDECGALHADRSHRQDQMGNLADDPLVVW